MLAKPQMWWPGINRQHPPARGLVGYWPMWEGGGSMACDISGYSKHISLTSGSWAASPYGYVWLSAATGTRAATLPMMSLSSFSLVWSITPVAVGDYYPRIRADNGWDGLYIHADTAGGVYCGTDQATRFTPTDTGANYYVVGELAHCAYTHDGTQGRLYKDGVLIAGPKNQAASTGMSAFWLGETGAGKGFAASLLELQYYSRAISGFEVRELFYDPFIATRPPSIARLHVAAAGGLSIPIAAHHYRQLQGAN